MTPSPSRCSLRPLSRYQAEHEKKQFCLQCDGDKSVKPVEIHCALITLAQNRPLRPLASPLLRAGPDANTRRRKVRDEKAFESWTLVGSMTSQGEKLRQPVTNAASCDTESDVMSHVVTLCEGPSCLGNFGKTEELEPGRG